MLFSKSEMESESLDQHFSFHLVFLFLIFIIVTASNNLPEMAMAMKSIVAILHFCCLHIVLLLTNLHKKMKGWIGQVSFSDVWGSKKMMRERLTR